MADNFRIDRVAIIRGGNEPQKPKIRSESDPKIRVWMLFLHLKQFLVLIRIWIARIQSPKKDPKSEYRIT